MKLYVAEILVLLELASLQHSALLFFTDFFNYNKAIKKKTRLNGFYLFIVNASSWGGGRPKINAAIDGVTNFLTWYPKEFDVLCIEIDYVIYFYLEVMKSQYYWFVICAFQFSWKPRAVKWVAKK